MARLLEIALHFARQGREGASIGAIFVLGDRRTLSPHLRQLILNPLRGHAQAARSIHNLDFLETLRELAAMDGAFVVNRRGVVDSARNVDLHGWTAEITDDATRVHLTGGSVTLDLGLGAAVTSYIEDGVTAGTPSLTT